MFHVVLDGSKYIAFREERARPAAQEYCSHKYQNGTLGSFKNQSDWEELTKLIQAAPWNYYWTGLKKENENYVCSGGRCTEFAKNKIVLKPTWRRECFFSIFKWPKNQLKMGCKSFSSTLYFICKVNKGIV